MNHYALNLMVAWCVGALTDPVSNRDLILSNGVQKGEREGMGGRWPKHSPDLYMKVDIGS